MKLLLDTNIVLDVLMDRMPFSDAATELFSMVENGAIIGYLCGTTITTTYYLVSKTLNVVQAVEEIKKLVTLFEVAPVNRHVIDSAISAKFNDFEDAVIHEAACYVGVDAIVTRNQKDFTASKIPVYSSIEMIKLLASRATF